MTDDLGHAGAEDLLRTVPVAHLAYNGPDGFPRNVPVGFLWKHNLVYVCTATTAPKVGALAQRPQVAISIDTPSPARALLIRGLASIDLVEGVAPEYLEAAAISMKEDELKNFTEQCRKIYPAMARIAITPIWARFFDFSAGRLPDFLQRLVSG